MNKYLFPYKGTKPPKLTADLTVGYAAHNIYHFSYLLEAFYNDGNKNIRVDECTEYLNIWKSVRDKNGDWDKLTEYERMEVISEHYEHDLEDCLSCGQDEGVFGDGY